MTREKNQEIRDSLGSEIRALSEVQTLINSGSNLEQIRMYVDGELDRLKAYAYRLLNQPTGAIQDGTLQTSN